jgi:hypothetical protein
MDGHVADATEARFHPKWRKMDIILWLVIFSVTSLFWCWVVFLGGAERIEGPLAGLLVHFRATEVSADGLRLIGIACWFLEGVMFVIGLIDPDARSFWLH